MNSEFHIYQIKFLGKSGNETENEAMANLYQEQRKQRDQDRLNRKSTFDSEKQFYPADLFILLGFDSKGHAVKERNPRWHDSDGFYIGRSVQK
jgi:hypothetical protein